MQLKRLGPRADLRRSPTRKREHRDLAERHAQLRMQPKQLVHQDRRLAAADLGLDQRRLPVAQDRAPLLRVESAEKCRDLWRLVR